MTGIRILGAQGSRAEKSNTTCIQVTQNTLIDAGNIIQGLGEDARNIDNIFLSHSHLDHIIDSAFLIENYFTTRKKPLKIYGLKETLKTLKKHFFNWEVWPDFSMINLINTNTPALEFITVEFNKEYKIENDITLTPIEAVHTVPTCGYLIKSNEGSIVFSGDTFKNPKLWELINKNKDIKAVMVDVSFSNAQSKVAQDSQHLTAKFLEEDLSILNREDILIYINHLKPSYQKKIVLELQEIGIDKQYILTDGKIISFKSGEIINQSVLPEIIKNKSKKIKIFPDRINLIETRIKLIQIALELSFYKEESSEEYYENEVSVLQSNLDFIKDTSRINEFLLDEDRQKILNIVKKNYKLNGIYYNILTEDERDITF